VHDDATLLLWTGGYSAAMGGTANGVGLLSWDGAALAFTGTAVPTPSPSFLTHDEGVLVAVDEGTGRVRTFSVGDAGALTPLGPVDGVETGANPCHIAAHRVGDHGLLLAANYGDGTLDVIDRDADGAARSRIDTFAGEGSGPRPQQDGPHAHSTLAVPSAEAASAAHALLSADLGADVVHVHALTASGLERRSSRALPAGIGPRDLLSLGGRIILLGEFGNAIFELALTPPAPDGVLSIVTEGTLVVDPVDGDKAAGLAASADGRFLYAGLRGSNRVAVVDAASLEPIASVDCGGDWPRHLAVVGDVLFVANQRSSTVAAFSLDVATGIPSFLADAHVPTPTVLLPVPTARP
jgi:6-phosphogluconolactonase